MNDQSTVSVVIPCYKQAHLLGEAIESVLAQTYPHVEIIVVDDGSPDNTSEVAARYIGVRCIRQQNKGLASARNTGLRECSGAYVTFLDADDRLVPGALEINLRHYNAHPECAFVSGRGQFVSYNGEVIPMRHRPPVLKDHYPELMRHNYILVGALLYRRDILQSVGGFDPNLPACEDYELHLRLARNFPIFCHDQVIMEYRQYNTSMSRNSGRYLKYMLLMLRAQKKYIKGNKLQEEACREGIRSYRDFYGDRSAEDIKVCLANRKWKKAVQDTLIFLRYHPRGFLTHARRKAVNLLGRSRTNE